MTTLQDPAKYAYLSDWSIYARSVNWWSTDMTDELSLRIWSSLSHGNASVFGWGSSEVAFVSAASISGAWVHASDWAKNLDVYSSLDAPSFTQLPMPAATQADDSAIATPSAVIDGRADKEVRALSVPFAAQSPFGSYTFPPLMFTPPSSPSDQVHTVTLLMTDGDNVQWMVDDFYTDLNFWGSPDRGLIPLGWTLSAALADLAPPIMSTLYASSSRPNASSGMLGSDTFVAATSGVGYAYPDLESTSLLQNFARLSSAYMTKADLSLLNVLGLSYSKSAATELLSQSSIDALLWYDYASYSALNGNVTWISVQQGSGKVQKPVIGGRFQLWDGIFDNVTSLASKLLAQKRDASTVAGYSLIPVHVWTNNVTSAVQLVRISNTFLHVDSLRNSFVLVHQEIH